MNLEDLLTHMLLSERADAMAKERHRRLDLESDLRMREEARLHDGWHLVEFNTDIASQNWLHDNPDYTPEEEPTPEQFVAQAFGHHGLTPSVTKSGWFIAPPTYRA